jgi:hypothetical protein
MPLNLRAAFRRQQIDDVDNSMQMDRTKSATVTDVPVAERDAEAGHGSTSGVVDGTRGEERVSEDAQRGVQHVEAVTLTWSKKTLIAVFFK